MRIDRFEDEGRCELRVRGELQLGGARKLLEQVLGEDSSRVVLDFSGCEVEDRALSALAELLSQAHLRLLEYLGATRPLDM